MSGLDSAVLHRDSIIKGLGVADAFISSLQRGSEIGQAAGLTRVIIWCGGDGPAADGDGLIQIAKFPRV
jgi:hypothetical protein